MGPDLSLRKAPTRHDEVWKSVLALLAVVAVMGGLYEVCRRTMRPFHNRAFLCLFALLLGSYVTWGAVAARFSFTKSTPKS
jgi:hypothetical protein